MDRAAADTALRYEPVGAFLVRMCSEPALFAISCRTSSEMQHMHLGSAAADAYASQGKCHICRCHPLCLHGMTGCIPVCLLVVF